MKHIDKKVGPLTKIVKRSKRTSKEIDDDVMQNVIYPILVNLEQSRRQIPDA